MNIRKICVLLTLALVHLQAELVVVGSLGGGLGNQMFISAAVYAYALDIGAEALFPNTGLAHVGVSPVLSKLRRCEGDTPNYPWIWETGHNWIDLPRNNPQSAIIAGYYQSARYFHHRRKEILALFSPSEEVSCYIKQKYSELLSQNTVAIHVRRGDYLHFTGNNGKTVMYNLSEDEEYYHKALEHFDCENDCFLFFSDDTDFVKSMDILQKIKHYYIVPKNEHWEDFYLMTFCKHHIIANSTFSWWGAYLSENPSQKVVFPLRWFGLGIPEGYCLQGVQDKYFKAASYMPMDHWITIE